MLWSTMTTSAILLLALALSGCTYQQQQAISGLLYLGAVGAAGYYSSYNYGYNNYGYGHNYGHYPRGSTTTRIGNYTYTNYY